MGRQAELALKMRTNQTALALLDEICEPYRGCDAEFEAEDPKNPGKIHPGYCHYTNPKGPLGILIGEAFDPIVNWVIKEVEVLETGDDDKIEEFYESWSEGGLRNNLIIVMNFVERLTDVRCW